MHREIADALRDAYAFYTSEHAGETPYAFGLYVVAENGLIVGSCYATEEATRRRAAEYEWMLGGTVDQRATVLRWWDADWPYCNDLPRLFDRINEKLRDVEDPRSQYLQAIAAVPAKALRGVFGADRSLLEQSIVANNDAATVHRYRSELAEGDRLYRLLQR